MRILIAGDFCPQFRVAEAFERDDYSSVLSEVKYVTANADYSIVNLECPVCYESEKPIIKVGSNLGCSRKGVKALKWAGFDCVTLANNHFYDFGFEGVTNTLETCEAIGLDTVGGGANLVEAAKTLYKKINGQTLAIINCCEHEFSIATETTAGSNPLNPIQQYYAIKEAKRNSDFILLIIHGGNEYYNYPSPRMKEIYHFFIDAGADAVINHHQHCFSGYETYQGKPIIYGLGNFCFDDNKSLNESWNEGYIAILDFNNDGVSLCIKPYIQCENKAKVEFNKDEETFLKKLDKINEVIINEESLRFHYQCFLNRSKVSFLFEPYSNRFMLALYRRHLLPSFITKKHKLLLLAYLQCESHIDKILNFLKK